ncbi:MAG: CZB domain-containing protein [Magnetococcales bacterium]|nr:CZB domain-containing protein [Magnetococcales bacterium]
MIKFSSAREAHLNWLSKLELLIKAKAYSFNNSETTCELGIWLYSCGLKKYNNIAEMALLESVHRSFHKSVASILELIKQEKYSDAENLLQKVKENESCQLLSLIAIIEKKISAPQTIPPKDAEVRHLLSMLGQ